MRREVSRGSDRAISEAKRVSLFARGREKRRRSDARGEGGMERFAIPKYTVVSVSSIDGKSSKFS